MISLLKIYQNFHYFVTISPHYFNDFAAIVTNSPLFRYCGTLQFRRYFLSISPLNRKRKRNNLPRQHFAPVYFLYTIFYRFRKRIPCHWWWESEKVRYECSCEVGGKGSRRCVHVLAMEISDGQRDRVEEPKQVLVANTVKKGGRPKKVGKQRRV